MADGLRVMGDMLPVNQWCVRITKDGKAEVCVSHVNHHRYWYIVNDVQIEGQHYESATINLGR